MTEIYDGSFFFPRKYFTIKNPTKIEISDWVAQKYLDFLFYLKDKMDLFNL